MHAEQDESQADVSLVPVEFLTLARSVRACGAGRKVVSVATRLDARAALEEVSLLASGALQV
jgi:hypothetical protein